MLSTTIKMNLTGSQLLFSHSYISGPARSLSSASFKLSKSPQDPTTPGHTAKSETTTSDKTETPPKSEDKQKSKAKTTSEADAELRERLEQMSGEGGASGIEYEDGKPVAMKRGVRNNMFRVI